MSVNQWHLIEEEKRGTVGASYLTAAKRTLILDSDKPLTILSIMFSVSVI